MSCQNKLRWYELLPLVSFFALRGRCRSCKTKISVQYPLVEFITGLIFAVLFLKFRDYFFTDVFVFGITYLYYAGLFSILVIIAVYDLKHKIIPDTLSLVFGSLAFVGLFFFTGNNFYPHLPNLLGFLSGIIIALPFALFWLVSNGAWMGLGDAKLAIGLGWLLGLSNALSGVVIAFWSGAIIGLGLVIFSKHHDMKSKIPFVPYLVFGALLAFLFDLNFFNL